MIKELLRKLAAQKVEREQYERSQHIEERYTQKKMSSNERELLRLQERDRQEAIKNELHRRRKIENEEFVTGRTSNPVKIRDVVSTVPFVVGHTKIFDHKATLNKIPNVLRNKRRFGR